MAGTIVKGKSVSMKRLENQYTSKTNNESEPLRVPDETELISMRIEARKIVKRLLKKMSVTSDN